MSTTKTTPNGQDRKTLASQLDRLDHILDGLSEGLNEAVSTAVQQAVSVAVQQAIQTVVAEVMANPDLLALLRSTADTPAAEARQKKNLLDCAWDWVKARLQACLRVARGCVRAVTHLRSRVLAILLGVGAALAAYFAGPWLGGLAAKAGPTLHRPAWAAAGG